MRPLYMLATGTNLQLARFRNDSLVDSFGDKPSCPVVELIIGASLNPESSSSHWLRGASCRARQTLPDLFWITSELVIGDIQNLMLLFGLRERVWLEAYTCITP